MKLPEQLAAECLAAHHAERRWMEVLKSILPDLSEAANGNQFAFVDMREQCLHLWSTGEASGRLPPPATLQPETEAKPSDVDTMASIDNSSLPPRRVQI